jgi:transposase
MNKITAIGIDLGKSVFHVHGVDERSREVVRKRLSRSQLARFMVKLEPCREGMEACGGSHHWARKFRGYGHELSLLPAQYVKA